MSKRIVVLVASSIAALVVRASALAVVTDDHYLAGYTVAVLERELDVHDAEVDVRDGVVTVHAPDLAGRERAAICDVLRKVPGVVKVEVRDVATAGNGGKPVECEGAKPGIPAKSAARARGDVREERAGVQAPAEAAAAHAASEAAGATTAGVVVRTAPPPRGEFLPGNDLFRPLLADPKWPRFSATYRYYIDDTELQNVGSANFGATMPLYRHTALPAGRWETGLQAGVFSIFDLDAESKDLINADYFVAVFGNYAVDDFSMIGRVYHQSSHVGDEFLLRGRVKNRVNLSYEALDLKLSYDFFHRALRVYGGAGYLFDRDPASLDPWGIQYGLEVTSPWSLDGAGIATPVVAADFQNQEETAWSMQYSVLGGIRFEGVRIAGSALLFGVEWFRGHSPNGQFYKEKVEWTGVGLHLFF